MVNVAFAATNPASPTSTTVITNTVVESPKALNFAVFINKPMVWEKEEGRLEGFDVDLWQVMAGQLNIPIKYHIYGSLPELLLDVKDNKIDMAVGGISLVSQRELDLDFSHPYLQSGLKILFPKQPPIGIIDSIVEGRYIKSLYLTLIKPAVIEIGFWFLAFIILIAHIIWLTDLGKNEQGDISDNYFRGIFESIYFCIVTCSTVGYGDICPKKPFSRILVIGLILSGIAFFANFTDTLSAQMVNEPVRNTISNFQDLGGKRIATVKGTTSDTVVSQLSTSITYTSLEEGVKLV
jgi:polar amino acid transport system substrate-binding protein